VTFSKDAKFCSVPLNSPIKVLIRGQRALFSRPEMTVERQSYEVPTISAMQGVLRAIFNHDGMDYEIEDIYVCRKIQFDSMIRNETKVMQDVNNPKPYLLVGEERTQRSSSFLTNVEYVVGARIVAKPNMVSPKMHSLAEFYTMFNRRLASGGYRHVPCLGQQEFSCIVKPYLEPYVKSFYYNKKVSFGIMYQKKVVKENGDIVPLFADTQIKDGRLVYSDFFVPYMEENK